MDSCMSVQEEVLAKPRKTKRSKSAPTTPREEYATMPAQQQQLQQSHISWGWGRRKPQRTLKKEKTLILNLYDTEHSEVDEDTTTSLTEDETDAWEDPLWVKDENLKKLGKAKNSLMGSLRKRLSSSRTSMVTPRENDDTTTSTSENITNPPSHNKHNHNNNNDKGKDTKKKKKRSSSLKMKDRPGKEDKRVLTPRSLARSKTEVAVKKKRDPNNNTSIATSATSINTKESTTFNQPAASIAGELKMRRQTRFDTSDCPSGRSFIDRRASAGELSSARGSTWEQDEATEPELRRSMRDLRPRSVSAGDEGVAAGVGSRIKGGAVRLKASSDQQSGTFRFYKSLSGNHNSLPPRASRSEDNMRIKAEVFEGGEKVVIGDDWNDISLSLRPEMSSPRNSIRDNDHNAITCNEKVETVVVVEVGEEKKNEEGGEKEEEKKMKEETIIEKKSEVTMNKGAVTFQKKCTSTVVRTDSNKGRVELKVEKTILSSGDRAPAKRTIRTFSWDNLDISGGALYKEPPSATSRLSAEVNESLQDLLSGSSSPVRLVEMEGVHRVKDVVAYFQRHQQQMQTLPTRSSSTKPESLIKKENSQGQIVAEEDVEEKGKVVKIHPSLTAALLDSTEPVTSPAERQMLRGRVRRSRSFSIINEERRRRFLEEQQIRTLEEERALASFACRKENLVSSSGQHPTRRGKRMLGLLWPHKRGGKVI